MLEVLLKRAEVMEELVPYTRGGSRALYVISLLMLSSENVNQSQAGRGSVDHSLNHDIPTKSSTLPPAVSDQFSSYTGLNQEVLRSLQQNHPSVTNP